jgi:predicted CoA-binding protein
VEGAVTPGSKEKIESFLSAGPYAVVGASRDRSKYGNKVLRCYLQHGLEVYAVNPNATEVEGVASVSSLRHLTTPVRGISVITPPDVTERVVEAAHAAGAGLIWMQPGAESTAAVARAEALGLTVISGGPCLLVTLGFRDA